MVGSVDKEGDGGSDCDGEEGDFVSSLEGEATSCWTWFKITWLQIIVPVTKAANNESVRIITLLFLTSFKVFAQFKQSFFPSKNLFVKIS